MANCKSCFSRLSARLPVLASEGESAGEAASCSGLVTCVAILILGLDDTARLAFNNLGKIRISLPVRYGDSAGLAARATRSELHLHAEFHHPVGGDAIKGPGGLGVA